MQNQDQVYLISYIQCQVKFRLLPEHASCQPFHPAMTAPFCYPFDKWCTSLGLEGQDKITGHQDEGCLVMRHSQHFHEPFQHEISITWNTINSFNHFHEVQAMPRSPVLILYVTRFDFVYESSNLYALVLKPSQSDYRLLRYTILKTWRRPSWIFMIMSWYYIVSKASMWKIAIDLLCFGVEIKPIGLSVIEIHDF